jgi:hypothetical protein
MTRHHLPLSNVINRISRPSCEPPYAINTSQRKQETFIYWYLLHWVLLSTKKKKTHNRTLLFCSIFLKHGSIGSILTTGSSLWTCACASATYCYTQRIYCHEFPLIRGVRWVLWVRGPLFGLQNQPRMIVECEALDEIGIGRGNSICRRKPASVSLRPPQIAHDRTWVRTGGKPNNNLLSYGTAKQPDNQPVT